MIRQSPYLRGLIQTSLSKVASRCFIAQATSVLRESKPIFRHEKYADIDWDNLGFGLTRTDYMYVAKCTEHNTFQQGRLSDYGNIELSPAAGVLNYGQGIFEGTKAFRGDDGRILLFRPDQNAIRMQMGAERMCMSAPSIKQFVEAVKQTALANRRWIPPPRKGSLYIRPLLIGTGPILGVSPAPEYTFLVYASPVGNYFKEVKPLDLYVDSEFHRATRGGAGGVKSITNYAPVMKAISRAKGQGFSDVLYLDSVHKKYIEEVSSSNIFLVKGNVLSTPATLGTILEGITRKSIIDIACDLGYKVDERSITIDELMQADEVFTTGTAVSIATVGSVTYNSQRVEYKTDGDNVVSKKLYKTLVGIQVGEIEDKFNWVVELD